MKILIVDDEPLIARDISSSLEDLGYEISTICFSYAEAIKSLSSDLPDFAILDINLGSGPGGIELAHHLNNHHAIPFLFLSSYSDPKTLNEAKMAHPMAYLVKPFEDRELLSAIEIASYNYARFYNKNSFSSESLNNKLDSPLTAKEFEITSDMYSGYTNSQLIEKHGVSISTIKTHINHIFDKCGVRTRTELIIKLRDWK